MTQPPALVWLPMDHRPLGEHQAPYLVLGDKYARAVKVAAQAQALTYPLAGEEDIPVLLDTVDGVLFTGSPSNVHPSHFNEAVADPSLPLDPQRDSLCLALVQACVARAVPFLGLCRGFQEINVAFGGSLHQAVHQVSGFMDHREPGGIPLAQQYAPVHAVNFVPGSTFADWAGGTTAQVNSLHGQGINQLAPGLRALGSASDGLVEAFEIIDAPAFAYAVQWHPEWEVLSNPFYTEIFQAFGKACRVRRARRLAASNHVPHQAVRS